MTEPLLTMEEVDAAIADRMAKAPPPRDRRKAAGDKRPTIELRTGETERIVDEVEDALIASDRGLYRRGGLIVATGFDKMQTWDGKDHRGPDHRGARQLRAARRHRGRRRFHEVRHAHQEATADVADA